MHSVRIHLHVYVKVYVTGFTGINFSDANSCKNVPKKFQVNPTIFDPAEVTLNGFLASRATGCLLAGALDVKSAFPRQIRAASDTKGLIYQNSSALQLGKGQGT